MLCLQLGCMIEFKQRKKHLPNIYQSNKVKEQSSQQMSMRNMKTFFQRKYPNESEEEIMVRTLFIYED